MSVIGSNIIAGASGTVETGYQIARSLRFNSADSAYLNRTPSVNGNRQIWTFSGWVKRAALGSVQNIIRATDGASNDTLLRFESSDKIGVYTNATSNLNLQTTAVYRDAAAFLHVLLAVDTTQATASNRAKLYVNGVQVTAFSTETYPTQNANTQFNSTSYAMNIGRYPSGAGSEYLSAYLADLYFIDGQALDPTSFGETDSATGVWVPKAYTGTYGTNGFWLKFDDNSGVTATTLGKDSSGNGNNWTPNNFSVTAGVGNDSLVDSPTNYGTDTGAGGEVRGNYATLNPLNKATNSSLSNGNLAHTGSGAAWLRAYSTIWFSDTSNFYAEVTMTGLNAGSNGQRVGIANFNSATDYVGSDANSWGYDNAARKFNNAVSTSYGASFSQGDVIGIHFNNGTLTFYKNGVSQGSAYTGLTGTFCFAGSVYSTDAADWNFGQRAWAYAPPSGAKALCTTNLPTPAIGASASTLASKNFNVITYTGDGASTRTLTGVGFQPDFVWAKNRSTAAVDNSLYDAIRGAGNDKELISNSTAAEGGGNHDSYGWLSAFTSDGFTTTKGTGANYYFNENLATYVAWNWKANGAGSSNTAGSITSTVSANTTAGISIATYTGNGSSSQTIGHGLGVAPKMVIIKGRSNAFGWGVQHVGLTGGNNYLALNQTAAQGTETSHGSSSNATSTTLQVSGSGGASSWSNANGVTYVAYAFAEIAGFSKFGSYTGNGSTDGPFVYCGFRPRFIMIKRSDSTSGWVMIDTARDTYNYADKELFANLTNAEASAGASYSQDVLSNGFKIRRASDSSFNASGGTYIFAAFAEAPFNYARAR